VETVIDFYNNYRLVGPDASSAVRDNSTETSSNSDTYNIINTFNRQIVTGARPAGSNCRSFCERNPTTKAFVRHPNCGTAKSK